MGTGKTSDDNRMKLVVAVVGLAAVAAIIALTATGGDETATGEGTSAEGDLEFATGPVPGGGPGDSHEAGEDGHGHGHGERGRYEDHVQDMGPNARREYFPGKGWATVVDDPNAVAPPPMESLPENPDPPELPPEELPQTATWKLGKTEHLTEVMNGRVERLEAAIEAARAAGDDVEAQRLQVRLDRTRTRITRLEEEAEELRAEAANEPPEEEVIREWEERTGRSIEELRGGDDSSGGGMTAEPTAPPPEGP